MVQRKKVLFFIESLAGGGAERVLATIIKHIDREKFDITVSTVTDHGIYNEEVKRLVKFKPLITTRRGLFYRLIYNSIYYALPAGLIYRLFFQKGNDIEIAFCEGFATKLLSKSPCKNKIAWVHTDMTANPWTQNVTYPSLAMEKKAYSKYNHIICVSENVRTSFESRFGLTAQTLYNPIDSDNIIKKSKEETYLPPKSVTRFVTAGRLVEQKGYDRLLKVAKKLRDDDYEFELWFLGDGVERDALTAYINQNDLASHVKIWGFVANPYPYIASGDVFICSSRSEGYSTAATEAIILGIPVATTRCAGMEELLGNKNECGYIVDNEDLALAEPMSAILTDPRTLDKIKAGAIRRGCDFNIKSLIEPIESLLL